MSRRLASQSTAPCWRGIASATLDYGSWHEDMKVAYGADIGLALFLKQSRSIINKVIVGEVATMFYWGRVIETRQ